ncbi:MAG: hypothetical protein ACPG51_20760 [Thiolinea sp.]
MNLTVLSIAMLIILILAIYAMTRGAAIEAEIQRLVATKPVEQIYDEYLSNNRTLNLYVAGGILLTGAFALIFFGAGGLDPRAWTFVNWIFAIIGLTATVAITLGQRNLYSSVKQNLAALLVTLLILTFVIFSEVATSSEREDSLVRDRSMNSPTLSAVLGQLNTPDQVPVSQEAYYRSEAARFRSLAEQCSGNCQRANLAKAAGFEARAAGEQGRIQSALLAQQSNKKALVETSKDLEYVEQNHTAVVRWLKEISASTFAAAMMFASLVFVIAFESGFHFTGTRNGIYIEALSRLGYSVKRKPKLPNNLTRKVDQPEPVKPLQEADSNLTRKVETDDENLMPDELEKAYHEWALSIEKSEIKPTMPPTKRFISERGLITGIKNIQTLAEKWLARAEREKITVLNPDRGVGKAKYLLANSRNPYLGTEEEQLNLMPEVAQHV